jgi:hypothetical protein
MMIGQRLRYDHPLLAKGVPPTVLLVTTPESPAETGPQPAESAARTSEVTVRKVPTFSRKVHGHYDPRAGAAMYSPIVGTFGALSVSAIVVVFTVPTTRPTHGGVYLALATGLLVVGMFGSLLGAVALGAISAEALPTANLAPAIMYAGVSVAISLAAMLGAFEVLAYLYEPISTQLFAMIVAAGGLFGVIFVAYGVGDSIALGPADDTEHAAWTTNKRWLRSRQEANRWAGVVALVASAPVVVSATLRLMGFTVRPTKLETYVLVGGGIALTMLGTLVSVVRTVHSADGHERELRMPEAFISTLTISGYVVALMIFLPNP